MFGVLATLAVFEARVSEVTIVHTIHDATGNTADAMRQEGENGCCDNQCHVLRRIHLLWVNAVG